MEFHYNNFEKKQYHENDPQQNQTKIWDQIKQEKKRQSNILISFYGAYEPK